MNDESGTIVIGCDHAAYEMKESVKAYLKDLGLTVEDVGTHGTESVHYPEYAKKVAVAVAGGTVNKGILLCGTGLGMSIAANRYPGVRAALCNDLLSAIMSRRHNDANILVLGGRVIGDVLAKEIVAAWLNTPFEGGRHQSRLEMIERGNS